MAYNESFEGWLGHGPEAAAGNMVWGSFEPKKWDEDDVDIQITHCGVCGTDVHTLRNGWGNTPYPCCVGHEIVGKAIRVGDNVKDIRVGDRVGVGAQAYSCLEPDCPECSCGKANYCARKRLMTYGSKYPDDKGMSYGDAVPSEAAAPMLCAGVTMFAPLKRHRCGPGKAVGIVGVGGLGHFGILFAKALGADKVVGISRRSDKRQDAFELGADQYIATSDDEGWAKKHSRSLDIIISTVSSAKMPLNEYMSLLKVGGILVQVGLPDGGTLPPITAWSISSDVGIFGSFIGSPNDIRDMFDVAARKQVKPWIETRPLAEANQAIVDFGKGKPRYRYVLVNEKHF